MGTTLYLLRQPLDRISASVFRADDEGIEIVFVEQAATIAPTFIKGSLVVGKGIAQNGSHPTLTYDELIEKVFSFDHVIVV